jgi:hypothetical protein
MAKLKSRMTERERAEHRRKQGERQRKAKDQRERADRPSKSKFFRGGEDTPCDPTTEPKLPPMDDATRALRNAVRRAKALQEADAREREIDEILSTPLFSDEKWAEMEKKMAEWKEDMRKRGKKVPE